LPIVVGVPSADSALGEVAVCAGDYVFDRIPITGSLA
jgi:hypothetical protein